MHTFGETAYRYTQEVFFLLVKLRTGTLKRCFSYWWNCVPVHSRGVFLTIPCTVPVPGPKSRAVVNLDY